VGDNGGVTATHALDQLVPLASGELNQDKVTPGLLGFVIFAAIAVGLWMLMKNMSKQMGKIDFEEQPDPSDGPQPAGRKATLAASETAPEAASGATPRP
jgi:hypothetical protein